MNRATVPQVVHVAICRGCGQPKLVSTRASDVRSPGCMTCLQGDFQITVERFRHDPTKKRTGRKPRRDRR